MAQRSFRLRSRFIGGISPQIRAYLAVDEFGRCFCEPVGKRLIQYGAIFVALGAVVLYCIREIGSACHGKQAYVV